MPKGEGVKSEDPFFVEYFNFFFLGVGSVRQPNSAPEIA